jgi:hypothetical protein
MVFNTKRMHGPQWLSGGAHFMILVAAAQAKTAAVWPYALLAMAGVSFVAWVANYRRQRQIDDLPTSRVASAAQGYVELFGRAEMLFGEPVTSRLSHQPCCWYSFEIEERDSRNNWCTVDDGRSVDHFLLVDETGQCVISPEGAEILTSNNRSWVEGDQRYSESLLLPASALYAVGEFSTTTAAASAAQDERTDVSALLSEWKDNPKPLLKRFDLDRDGKIDMKEWELARLQARREVRQRQAETASRPVDGVNLLRKPRDGRLFLLANEMPDKLGSRYRFWSWVHLVIFFGAGAAALIML